jgi:hypothetical protein
MIPQGLERRLVGVVSAACGAGAVVLGVLAAIPRPRIALGTVGFEIVILAAAVTGVLYGRGRYRQAPILAAACIGGTICVAAILAGMAAGWRLGSIPLLPFAGAHAAGGAAIAALAAMNLLSRHPRSWRLAGLALLLAAPVVLAIGVMFGPVRAQAASAWGTIPGVLRATLAAAGFLVGAALASGSIHLLIRAFELGRTDDPAPTPSGEP